MAGIGDIKLGMKKSEFEKLMNQTYKWPNLTSKKTDYYQDTIPINYKGLEADVIFQKEYRKIIRRTLLFGKSAAAAVIN
jgi:hypothetical protein